MATWTCTPRATQTLPTPPSFLPRATPNWRRPTFTPYTTQPPCSFIPALHLGSASLNPRCLKKPPGHSLLGRATRARKNTTAAPVTVSSKSTVPKGPPPLPAAQRHFFALRTSPTLPNDSFVMTAILSNIMAAVLKEANCSLPLYLTTSVNCNGAVTLTANPYTPSSAYSPFFDATMQKLNQSFLVTDNPF